MSDSCRTLTSLFNSIQPIATSQMISEEDFTESQGGTFRQKSKPEQKNLKQLLMTVHFLFPHELLPALDLLDRRLVKYVRNVASQSAAERVATIETFYVQSASAVTDQYHRKSSSQSGRFRNAWNPTKAHYEVRLDSWSCTCAAFAHSQMKALLDEDEAHSCASATADLDPTPEWQFGGFITRFSSIPPVCKHLLAVVLSKAAPVIFGDGVEIQETSEEGIAGWAGGWSDT